MSIWEVPYLLGRELRHETTSEGKGSKFRGDGDHCGPENMGRAFQKGALNQALQGCLLLTFPPPFPAS